MPLTLYSWNVNGIRAAQKKGFLDWLHATQPDILTVQETKASPEQLTEDLRNPNGYHSYWAVSTVKKGYSGVGLYTRQKPTSVEIGLGVDAYDGEGRTVIAHYDAFVLMAAYFPSASQGRDHLPHKLGYLDTFLERAEGFRAEGKPVIFCGDVNVAHQAIDLARPKENANNIGFLPEERAKIDNFVNTGYIDTYRHRHPDQEGAYSWWSYRSKARERNIGWRLDYVFISSELLPRLQNAAIHADVLGSDHCPISVTLDL